MADSITCPGCQSEISTDGRTLLKRSAHLRELEETADKLPALERLLAERERGKPSPANVAPKPKKKLSPEQLAKMKAGRAAKKQPKPPEPKPSDSKCSCSKADLELRGGRHVKPCPLA